MVSVVSPSVAPVTMDIVSFVFSSLICGLYFLGSINYYCILSVYRACLRVIFKCHYLTFSSYTSAQPPVFRAVFCFCVIAEVTFVSHYCHRIRSGWRRSSICLRPTRNSMRRYIAHSFIQVSLFCYVKMDHPHHPQIHLGMVQTFFV